MEALPKKPVAHKAAADKPAKKPAVAKPRAVRKPKVAKEAAPVAKPVEAAAAQAGRASLSEAEREPAESRLKKLAYLLDQKVHEEEELIRNQKR